MNPMPTESPKSKSIPLAQSTYEKALVDAGDPTRMLNVLRKVKREKAVTIGVLGGSITEGTAASSAENRWANRVADWWKTNFSEATIRLVNAGIGSTGSLFGAFRVQDDLLNHQPDFVILEYAVNDWEKDHADETLEGIIRKILSGSSETAILLLFTMDWKGRSAQDIHTIVGQHYQLPMISYRDAIWPEIENENITWKDLSPDWNHPNDRGHAFCAAWITQFLDDTLQAVNSENRRNIDSLPQPVTENNFEKTNRMLVENMVPVQNSGWRKEDRGWVADAPGSELVFEVRGQCVAVRYAANETNTGIVEATIANHPPCKLKRWGNWNHTPVEIVGTKLGSENHKIRFRLLDETVENNAGSRFELLEILACE